MAGGSAPKKFTTLEALTVGSPYRGREGVQIVRNLHECFLNVVQVTFVGRSFRDGFPLSRLLDAYGRACRR